LKLVNWTVTEKEDKVGDPLISLAVKLEGFDTTEDAKDFIGDIRKAVMKATGQTLFDATEGKKE
jgi:hypothetical protein